MGMKAVAQAQPNATFANSILSNVPSTDTSGTPGNATANTRSGRSAIAAAAASVTITNSTVTTASKVFVQYEGAAQDATLTSLIRVTLAAGSFTVTGNAAATAAVVFGWLVVG